MNSERMAQMDEILAKRSGEDYKGHWTPMDGTLVDRQAQSKKVGLKAWGVPKNSKVAKMLNENGFYTIYPKALSEEEIATMSQSDRVAYEGRMSKPLIIEKSPELTQDMAQMIEEQYLSNYSYSGKLTMKNMGSIGRGEVTNPVYEGIDNSELNSIYQSLGFNSKLDDRGRISISGIKTNNMMVTKGKFATMFEKAKGKVQGMFQKIKSAITRDDRAQTNVRNNDDQERG